MKIACKQLKRIGLRSCDYAPIESLPAKLSFKGVADLKINDLGYHVIIIIRILQLIPFLSVPTPLGSCPQSHKIQQVRSVTNWFLFKHRFHCNSPCWEEFGQGKCYIKLISLLSVLWQHNHLYKYALYKNTPPKRIDRSVTNWFLFKHKFHCNSPCWGEFGQGKSYIKLISLLSIL